MKNENNSSYLDVNDNGGVKKERHIVSWSQEEDDILREQIRLHGSENWAIIASKFKDKTTRQCKRRWFTYLNSDFKKGGWSPEEDILLCEAQRIYGNRWTEIAKVVSGRTDNAVKNRFTTLCKKRAKREASAKVNSIISYVNLSNKRVICHDGLNSEEGSENAAPLKKIRCNESSPDTVSTLLSNLLCGKTEECDAKVVALPLKTAHVLQAPELHQHHLSEEKGANEVERISANEDVKPGFSSPTHATPLFRVMAAAIPSPKFSQSEKKFLMKTLGLESTPPSPIKNPSQPPPCKRSLLHCL